VPLVSEAAPELAVETAWVCLAAEAGTAAGEGVVEMGFLGAMIDEFVESVGPEEVGVEQRVQWLNKSKRVRPSFARFM